MLSTAIEWVSDTYKNLVDRLFSALYRERDDTFAVLVTYRALTIVVGAAVLLGVLLGR